MDGAGRNCIGTGTGLAALGHACAPGLTLPGSAAPGADAGLLRRLLVLHRCLHRPVAPGSPDAAPAPGGSKKGVKCLSLNYP